LGEFPLNDAWSYHLTLKELINNGQFTTTEWQATPLLPQYLINYGMGIITGHSYIITRLINVFFMGLSLALLYKTISINTKKIKFYFVLVLLVLINPIYLNVSNTFLPESIYITILILLTNIILRILKSKKFNFLIFIILTSLFLIGALQRQYTFILFLPFITATIIYKKNKLILPSIASMVTSILIFAFLTKEWSQYFPISMNYQLGNIYSELTSGNLMIFKKVLYYGFNASAALGILCIPITPLLSGLYRKLWNTKWPRICVIISSFLLITIAKYLFIGKSFPFTGNILHELGIGPLIFTGYNTQEIYSNLPLNVCFMLLTFIGVSHFSFISFAILHKLKDSKPSHGIQLFFIVLLIIVYSLPFCLSYYNDRYLIFPFILLIMALSFLSTSKIKQSNWVPSIFFLAGMLLYSVVGNHDYFAIQRTKNDLVTTAESKWRLKAKDIDAGFEHNAYHSFDFKKYLSSKDLRWWWVDGKNFIISPVPNFNSYSTLKQKRTKTWSPFAPRYMFLHEKSN
jgi:hypothetical protein